MTGLSDVHTVLAAVADPADRRRPVIDRASHLAEAFGARVILFHAAFDPTLSAEPFGGSKARAQARGKYVAEQIERLETIADALRRRGLDAHVHVVWEEPAHESIIRAAIREKAQLVVAGPHDPRRGLRLTDWELLRMSSAPLLLVRGGVRTRSPGVVLAALDPTHANDKPASLDLALAMHGARMAEALGVDLHIAHCVPVTAYAFDETTPAARKRLRDERQAQLRAVLEKAGVRARKVHVPEGAVESVMPRLASELSAQLLVLGAISRRGLQRFAVGNTAERVIHESPCDLLIIKPEGFRPRLGRSLKQEIILPAAKPHATARDVRT